MAPTTVAPAEGRGKRRMPPLPRPRSSCPRQQQRTGRRTCLPPTSCTRTRSCPLGSPRRSKLSSRFPATRLPGFRAITRIRTRTRARGRMRASGVPPQAPQGDGEDSQGQFYIPRGEAEGGVSIRDAGLGQLTGLVPVKVLEHAGALPPHERREGALQGRRFQGGGQGAIESGQKAQLHRGLPTLIVFQPDLLQKFSPGLFWLVLVLCALSALLKLLLLLLLLCRRGGRGIVDSGPRANGSTKGWVPRLAVLATVKNDLQVEVPPTLGRIDGLEILLNNLHALPAGQAPPCRQTMDMRVDWKGGDAKGL